MMPDTSNFPTANLAFRDGSSDKVYFAQVKPQGDGFVVEFQFGRRGSSLSTGCKTPAPVSYEAACKVLDKLVREKRAKGYSEGETGTPFAGTDKAGRVSGLAPQLLNTIDPSSAQALILDGAWCMQRKFDGVRTLLQREVSEITGINKKGLTVALPQPVVEAALGLPAGLDFVLDGELIGETLFVWDVLRHDGVDTKNLPLSMRLSMLDAVPDKGAVQRIATHRTREEKERALTELRAIGAEGVVFKQLSSRYVAGRPPTGGAALKHKFLASATVRVRGANPGKRSVVVELMDATGTWVDVGSVTIPPNHEVPVASSLAEVQYLYANRGGCLFQPVYLGVRTDQDESDCRTDQLQYKGEAIAA